MQPTEAYLLQTNTRKHINIYMRRTLLILSLLIILGVFWGLKLTGITMAGEAFCGLEEHIHDDSCIPRELICELEEIQPHVHDDSCLERVLICTVLEEPPTEEETLPEEETTAEESEEIDEAAPTEAPHIHDENCFQLDPDSVICGLDPTSGHLHGEDCWQISGECPLEEHIHVEACYSDIHADLETADDWKAMMAQLPLTDNPAENLPLVLASQLGYEESILNFQVDEHGVRRGVTRYGQWYGNPYGDWSAMFVGFCLDYAGFEDFPLSAGPETMRLKWEEAGLYGAAEFFVPEVTDLLFLDENQDGTADVCAIITAVTEAQLTLIRGDFENTVAEMILERTSPSVMGYGKPPRNTRMEYQPGEGETFIGQLVDDPQVLFDEGTTMVVYIQDGEDTYALDGYGSYTPVQVDSEGWMYVDTQSPELFFWMPTPTEEGMAIINTASGMHLPDSGVMLLALDDEGGTTGPQNQFARAGNRTIWFDGTCGGLMAYNRSQNSYEVVADGGTYTLPASWPSPAQYKYKLQGWYDVETGNYYKAGAKITVTSNMILYADWVAETYDIGVYNASVSPSLDLSEFVTTHVFDYGILFNVLSTTVSVSRTNTSHTETWNMKDGSLSYIFRDWDATGDISYPNGVDNRNTFPGGGAYLGLYTPELGRLLFDTRNSFNPDTGEGVIGKTYLGEGNYLFQIVDDPSDPHYGYYYYNSEKHAASYNQTDQRFYVYDYLVRTSESASTSDEGKYSDFLPLNSPYANTNGKNVPTYTYGGDNNEYQGTQHYSYEAKYSESNNNNQAANNVMANFWLGMSTEIKFYLPNVPGSRDASGEYGNQDLYGRDMHFQFSGDDDVWIFIDDQLVLDLGGIHGIEGGDINFSTGVVTVDNPYCNNKNYTPPGIQGLAAGDHTLTIYYLERGASMGNCAIYFNLAPRFSFSIQKEDVLTRDVLNGAQFSVYTNSACTTPAQLWTSKASHDRGDPATNVFTVVNGRADMWGLGAGNIYYIKETKPPDQSDYTYSSGIIRLTIDKSGSASYNVELIKDGNNNISGGFTVHGFRIDEETQEAYIVATNAPSWVEETTSIKAMKHWNDSADHSGQSVTVYLTVTDPDGTVRRLQEAQLSQANGWTHEWKNMPKFLEDGVTLVQYGVEEAYVSGYYSTVEQVTSLSTTTTKWSSTTNFENGKTYILKNGDKYLSTLNSDGDTGFKWVSESEAQSSNLALWTAKVSNGKVMFTNGANQTFSFWYGDGSPTDFFAATSQSEDKNTKRYFSYKTSGSGIKLYYTGNKTYYVSSKLNSSKKFDRTEKENEAIVLTPYARTVTTTTTPITGVAFRVTNTPLERETSLTVSKTWDYGDTGASGLHEKAQVTVELFANGKGTGRTVTLSLKNGWTDTFRGLPYVDSSNAVISYTVKEIWQSDDWLPFYGEIRTSHGPTPTYSTTITNLYRRAMGIPILPSTGTAARMIFVLVGSSIMLTTLVIGFAARRKRERRMK